MRVALALEHHMGLNVMVKRQTAKIFVSILLAKNETNLILLLDFIVLKFLLGF